MSFVSGERGRPADGVVDSLEGAGVEGGDGGPDRLVAKGLVHVVPAPGVILDSPADAHEEKLDRRNGDPECPPT